MSNDNDLFHGIAIGAGAFLLFSAMLGGTMFIGWEVLNVVYALVHRMLAAA